MAETQGDGVGRLLDASGAQPLLNECFRMLRKGGTVVLVGIAKSALHVENFARNILFKSQTLHTVHGRRIFHTWRVAERLVHEGRLPGVDSTISHHFAMSRYEEAFALLMSGQCCKILVDPHA